MTLPSNIIFPIQLDRIFSLNPEEQELQWLEMIKTLQEMYENIVDVVNGTYTYATNNTISGSTSAGSGTYGNRESWQLRQGLECQLWFDIEWSAHTGTGNLQIDLPWEVSTSNFTPFIGVIEASDLTFDAGYTWLTINCQPDTFNAIIMQSGDGLTSQPLSIQTSGRLKGYVKYIGKEFDTA